MKAPWSVSTSDPVVAEAASPEDDRDRKPDATVVTETTALPDAAPPYPGGPGAVVVVERPAQAGPRERGDDQGRARKDDEDRDKDDAKDGSRDDRGRAQNEDDEDDRDRRRDRDDGRGRAHSSSSLRSLLLAGTVALVCGVVGAFGYSYFFGPDKSDKDSDSGKQSSSKKGSGSSNTKSGSSQKSGREEKGGSFSQEGSDIPGFTEAEDADALRKQIEHLAERVDRLHQRLDTLSQPRNETPPDLRTLQIKVGELARSVDDIGGLPSKFRRLDNRMEELKEELKTLRDRIATAHDDRRAEGIEREVEVLSGSSPTATTTATAPPISPAAEWGAPDATMAQAIALFRQGKYPEASHIFRKLQLTRPDDARVWYYSALAYGLTTGDWGRGAQELVEMGARRERAGTPPGSQVDAAFAGLTRAQGRDWLAGHRNGLTRR